MENRSDNTGRKKIFQEFDHDDFLDAMRYETMTRPVSSYQSKKEWFAWYPVKTNKGWRWLTEVWVISEIRDNKHWTVPRIKIRYEPLWSHK